MDYFDNLRNDLMWEVNFITWRRVECIIDKKSAIVDPNHISDGSFTFGTKF